jgi:hypothetical protein
MKIPDDPQIESYEELAEFPVSKKDDWHSIIYSFTNKAWRVWFIDSEGNEVEKIIESIDKLDGIDVDGIMVGKEMLQEFHRLAMQN